MARATEAVLVFLRDTRVGCIVYLAPPEEEGEDESKEGEGPGPPQDEGKDGGPGPPWNTSFLCLSFVFLWFVFLWRNLDEGG